LRYLSIEGNEQEEFALDLRGSISCHWRNTNAVSARRPSCASNGGLAVSLKQPSRVAGAEVMR